MDVHSRPHLVEIAAALKEITATITSTTPFPDAISTVLQVSCDLLPTHIRCGITLISQGEPAAYSVSGLAVQVCDEVTVADGDGPSMESIRTRGIVLSQDLDNESRWPVWTRVARDHGVRGVLAYPFDVDAPMVGALNLYADTSHAFVDEIPSIAMLVADHSSLLLRIRLRQTSQEDLLTQLHQGTDASVERAIGIVMAQRGCSPDKALHHLYDAATHLGVGVSEVANRLVRTVSDRGVGTDL